MPDLVVRALGVPVGITARHDVEAARLRRQWSRAITDEPARVEVAPGGTDEVDGDYALTSAVTMAALRETAGRRLNLHAGGVCDDDERLLVVVGASGAGKTTAIRRLAERLGYLSDETVSLDPAGPPYVAHPHPKPLSVITDPDQPRRKSQLSPDELGLGPTPRTATLHRVLLLRRGPARNEQYAEHGLVVVPISEAVVEIVPQTSSLMLLPDPLLTLVRALRSAGGPVVLEYEEFADHVDEVVGLLDLDLEPDEPEPEHAPGAEPADPGPGLWTRGPWHDAVRLDEEVLVLADGEVFRLDGLGAVVWWTLGEPRDEAAVATTAQAVLGEHPDAARLVADTLEVLAGAGLVRQGGRGEREHEPQAD